MILALAAAEPAAPDTEAGDLIRFRLLERGDFRAQLPPPDFVLHTGRLEAASCLRITWPPELRVDFSDLGGSGGTKLVAGELAELTFFAVFDRQCSWWAPQTADPGYALEHEQVHFAIAEHRARELTRELALGERVIRGRGATREEALAGVLARLQRLTARAAREAGREHAAFDRETRRSPSRSVQRAWIRRYEQQLGERLSQP